MLELLHDLYIASFLIVTTILSLKVMVWLSGELDEIYLKIKNKKDEIK